MLTVEVLPTIFIIGEGLGKCNGCATIGCVETCDDGSLGDDAEGDKLERLGKWSLMIVAKWVEDEVDVEGERRGAGCGLGVALMILIGSPSVVELLLPKGSQRQFVGVIDDGLLNVAKLDAVLV